MSNNHRPSMRDIAGVKTAIVVSAISLIAILLGGDQLEYPISGILAFSVLIGLFYYPAVAILLNVKELDLSTDDDKPTPKRYFLRGFVLLMTIFVFGHFLRYVFFGPIAQP